MCRGFQHNERQSLKIKAFYIHLSSPISSPQKPLHDSLTLHFLRRDPLETNGSTVRPGSPSFLTLHRVFSADKGSPGAVYGSRDPVKATQGAKFEIYYGAVKFLKGSFQKDEGQNWKLECKSDDTELMDADVEVAVEVEVDGHVEFLSDKVDMHLPCRRRRRKWRNSLCLEEIPEEGELGSGGCCWCNCNCESTVDDDEDGESEIEEMGEELESVRWAVDAAILVVSLGLGYFVSRASCKKKMLSSPWR